MIERSRNLNVSIYRMKENGSIPEMLFVRFAFLLLLDRTTVIAISKPAGVLCVCTRASHGENYAAIEEDKKTAIEKDREKAIEEERDVAV